MRFPVALSVSITRGLSGVMLALLFYSAFLGIYTPASADDGDWQSLFDGKTLSGWHVRCRPEDNDKRGYWRVEDGVILAQGKSPDRHHYIWLLTDKEYDDFELKLKVQTFADCKGNSGVQVRSRYDDDAFWLDGPQIDIHPAGPWRSGFIYDETRSRKVWLWPDVGRPANAKPEHAPEGWTWQHAGDSDHWNDIRIVCRGTQVQSFVNGIKVADLDGRGILDDADHRRLNVGVKGHIGLQIHPGQDIHLRFKDIHIRTIRGQASFPSPVPPN
ncbi:3-keto-disaccharide hydrolase [Crateriforma conspicua]|uniref:3-keto-disaccharide hydrolase n=1 Tax=Crateriforma conspicua TaxID=2527996 RepID=UPI00118CF302|nr:DUF1080 domain-containing protein [Crateriforma conspicua]QDV63095.1 hypothetical protein Mal65_22360 [Crateriforma conspicua]